MQMKIIASIMCLYMLGLFVQPALFPLKPKQEKVMACCKQHAKHGQDKSCPHQSNSCAGNCNPFFTCCPFCAISFLTEPNCVIQAPVHYIDSRQQFFSSEQWLISNYCADILHPPQAV